MTRPEGARRASLPLLERWARTRPLLPYYHMVSDQWVPHVSPLYGFRTVKQFTEDVDFFLQYFRPLQVDELLEADRNGGAPPGSFLLTFDDGFREMAEIVAPILRAKGVPAVFFLNSSTVDNSSLALHQKIGVLLHHLATEASPAAADSVASYLRSHGARAADAPGALRSLGYEQRALLDPAAEICGLDFRGYLSAVRPYLDSEQVKRMLREGFSIGGHSIDHPHYADLSLEEQLRQTRQSMLFLRERFDPSRRLFAFPHNDDGVSRDFFETIFAEGAAEATFGTSAPYEDEIARNHQRFSMERTSEPARAILARQSFRRLRQFVAGRSKIIRPRTKAVARQQSSA
jgi:peptidoglycan/xylan/chitin deacetylase (PgdA/CDA1 family)